METATSEALAEVDQFTSSESEQEAIKVFLSEIPIGDEYGVLSEEDHILGEKFFKHCEAKGIKLWSEEGNTMNKIRPIHPNHVTFTGIDKKTDLDRCAELSSKYPIEWAILYGTSSGFKPRFPDQGVVESFKARRDLRKSIHFCGKRAAAFQSGDFSYDDYEGFNRVQVNARASDYDIPKLRQISEHTPYQIILQHRGLNLPKDPYLVYLYDLSGGRGELPARYPTQLPDAPMAGIAGGIGPENVAHVNEVVKLTCYNYWLDMETLIRTDDWLDLDKCEAVCKALWS